MSTTKINNDEVMGKIANLKNDINMEMLNIGDSQNNVFKHLKKKSLESKLSIALLYRLWNFQIPSYFVKFKNPSVDKI